MWKHLKKMALQISSNALDSQNMLDKNTHKNGNISKTIKRYRNLLKNNFIVQVFVILYHFTYLEILMTEFLIIFILIIDLQKDKGV